MLHSYCMHWLGMVYLITNSLFLSPYLLLHLFIQLLNFFVMRICFAVYLTIKMKNNIHNSERLLASITKATRFGKGWGWRNGQRRKGSTLKVYCVAPSLYKNTIQIIFSFPYIHAFKKLKLMLITCYSFFQSFQDHEGEGTKIVN